MDKIETLHELCDTVMHEIEESNDKIRATGNKLTSGDVDYIDKLTHTLKSLKTTIAMLEADSGYSTWYIPRYYGEDADHMTNGRSYTRGRTYTKRDSMGRYSRGMRGYSYADSMEDIISDIHGIMHELPEEKRRKVERLVNELES